MSYVAPLKDMLFCMQELAGLEEVAKLPASRTRAWIPRRPCSMNAPS